VNPDVALQLVFPVVFFGIIAGVLLHAIIGRYITGEMGAVECTLVAGIYVGMVVSIMSGQIILAGILLVVLIFLLLLPTLQGRRTVRALYDEQMVKFRAAIESDPGNLAARGRLAETLYKTGDLDGAIAEYGELLKLSPTSLEEARRLTDIMQENERRRTPPIICPSCGASNPPNRTRCYQCEGYLAISGEIKKWLVRGGMKQICITWAITVAVITLIVAALTALPLAARIGVAAFLLVVVLSAQLLYAWRRY